MRLEEFKLHQARAQQSDKPYLSLSLRFSQPEAPPEPNPFFDTYLGF